MTTTTAEFIYQTLFERVEDQILYGLNDHATDVWSGLSINLRREEVRLALRSAPGVIIARYNRKENTP